MATILDPNFFTQIGLDSGSLTMLGVVVHSFGEAGEYRGVALGDGEDRAAFSISVDPGCAAAGVNIDLASLTGGSSALAASSECGCEGGQGSGQPGAHYVVHPKGHAVFHVSGGAGGYSVNVRRNVEDPKTQAYDSRVLEPGDIFSAVIARPGRYSVRNELGEARAEVTVSYPGNGATAYAPPAAEVVELGDRIEPARIALTPLQGLNFHVATRARIVIELEEPDDGPRGQGASAA